jgi:hypothetical protein
VQSGADDVAALIALFRELRTAGKERAGGIKAGLQSAWREFSFAAVADPQFAAVIAVRDT